MPPIACPECASYDLDGRPADDGRIETQCGHSWLRGEPRPAPRKQPDSSKLREVFAERYLVSDEARRRVEVLKQRFLADRTEPRPEVAVYWQKYQRVFSQQGLPGADPQHLKDFANDSTGANPGNMSVFNTAWNSAPAESAARTRDAIAYLLHGPPEIPLEDRLTALIEGEHGIGMTGFREALLTKVLCVVHPDRFLPIVKYTGLAGKKEIAEKLFGLRLPDGDSAQWTIGRLVLWSNDLLVSVIGDGFVDQPHAAAFLWWAKDEV